MRKIIIIGMVLILLLPLVSGMDWDNIKSYNEETKTITIYNWNIIGQLFNWKLAEYTLDYNSDTCMINCESRGKTTLYEQEKLFSNLRFEDLESREKVMKDSQIYLLIETLQQITDKPIMEEVCRDVYNNATFQIDKICQQEQTGWTYKERSRLDWVEYNYEELPSGDYTWKIKGRKGLRENLDWIGSAFGKELDEWAWYNSSCAKRRSLLVNNSLVAEALDDFDYNITLDTSAATYNNLLYIIENDTVEREWFNHSAFGEVDTHIRFQVDLPASGTNTTYIYYDCDSTSMTYNRSDTQTFYSTFTEVLANVTDNGLWTYQGITDWEYDGTDMHGKGVDAGSGGADAQKKWVKFNNQTPLDGGIMQVEMKTSQLAGSKYSNIYKGNDAESYLGAFSDASNNLDTAGYWKNAWQGNNASTIDATDIKINTYYNLTIQINGTKQRVWVNGTYGISFAKPTGGARGSFGFQSGVTASMTITELSYLRYYYDGFQPTYTIGAEEEINLPPTVQLHIPLNNTNQYYQTINFTYNTTDPNSDPITNCALWLEKDGVWELNKSDSTITTVVNQSLNITSNYENFNWSIACYDNQGNQGNSTKYNMTVQLPQVVVALQSPANNTNHSYTTINLTYQVSEIGGVIDSCNLSIDGVLTDTDTSIIQSTNQYFNETFTEGSYLWKVTCNDTWNNIGTAAERNFTVDTTSPTLSGLTDPPPYRQAFLTLPNNVTLNYSATDSIFLKSCYYNTSESSTLNIFTCNLPTKVNFSSEGNKTIWYYANDSVGNEQVATTNVYIYDVDTQIIESRDPTSEGIQNTITLIVNATEIPLTIANLVWNNTNYGQGIRTKPLNNSYRFVNSFIIPFDAGNSTGALINYNYTYNISNFFNGSKAGSQTIYDLSVDNCSTNTRTLINYTLRDEGTQTIISGDIETAVTIVSRNDVSINWTFNQSYSNVENISICIPDDLYGEYDLDVVTSYEGIGEYVLEYHYFDNFNLSNHTKPQLINLYDLNSTASTTFLITYLDSFYLPVQNSIIDVLRYYVSDNAFKSVEMGQVDDTGQTRTHLVTEDVIYKFVVRSNNKIIYTSPQYFALCQTTPCQINLYQSTEISSNYSYYDNLIYTMTVDESARTVEVVFLSEDSSNIDVSINVTRTSAYNNVSVCFDSDSASSGTLTCLIPTTYDNSSYIVVFEKDSSFVDRDYITFSPDQAIYFGGTGILLAVFLILTLGFMAMASGFMVIVSIIAGVILAGVLVLINTGSLFGVTSALMWLMVAGVIIIWKIAKRRVV